MKLPDSRLSTRIALIAIALVAAGATALLFIENARLRDAYLNEQRIVMERGLRAEKSQMLHVINTLRQDLRFLSNTPPVSGIMRATLNRSYDPEYDQRGKVWEERLQQIFSVFSAAHPEYYQMRYIGVAQGGREIVRVDNRAGKIGARTERAATA